MTDHDLRSLRSWVAWPPAPDVAGRLELRPRRSRRRGLIVAVAVALLAIATALAVPHARSAILRFFHLGGVTIEHVSTLPLAQARPLASDLGQPVTAAGAEATLGAPFRGPQGTLFQINGIVSTILAAPQPVLLSEAGSAIIIKKLVTSQAEPVVIEPGVQGIWIAGPEHVVFFPAAAPRLAGDTLVWASGNVTFRLEGHALTQARALALARQILGTPAP
jgi:hypothetical protein